MKCSIAILLFSICVGAADVNVSVNDSAAVFLITYYAGDGDLSGRAPFVVATLDEGASGNFSLSVDPESLSVDPVAFTGSCAYTFWAQNATEWNAPVIAGLLTPSFRARVPQLSGCSCVNYFLDAAGATPIGGCSYYGEDDAMGEAFFGSNTSRWSMRVSSNGTLARIEALMVLDIGTLLSLPGVTVTSDGRTTVATWTLFVSTLSSTVPFGFPGDALNLDTESYPTSVEFMTSGAVWTALAPGGELSSFLLRPLSSSSKRLNDTSSLLWWDLEMYVRSPMRIGALGPVYINTTVAGAVFACSPGMPACTTIACGTIAQSTLPFVVGGGLTGTSNWVPYTVMLTCVSGLPGVGASSDWVLPPSTVNVGYSLEAGNTVVTDTTNTPSASFVTQAVVPSVHYSMQTIGTVTKTVQLLESTIRPSSSISQIVAANEGTSAVGGTVVYSQAIATYTTLVQPAPSSWQLTPTLALLVATTDEPTYNGDSVPLNESSVLHSDWCGLDRTDIQGAFVFLQSSSAGVMENVSIASELSSHIYGNDLVGVLKALVASNMTVTPAMLQSDIKGSTSQGLFAIPDTTGGFAVPVRNLFVSSTQDSFYLSICMVVKATPVAPVDVNGWYPLFYTNDAAVAATIPDATGNVVSPVLITGEFSIDYFMPWATSLGASCAANLSYPGLPPSTTLCSNKRRRILQDAQLFSTSSKVFSSRVKPIVFESRDYKPPEAHPKRAWVLLIVLMVGLSVGIVVILWPTGGAYGGTRGKKLAI